MLEIGDLIPDLTLPDQNGQERPLRQLLATRGAIVYFYPKDNTPGCTVEARDFQSLSAEFATLGLSIIGISKDSVASHQKFCLKQELSFTLLSDASGDACVAFGTWKEKKNYGRTYMGIVRSTFIVDCNGVVKKVYPSVKTMNHATLVLTDVRTLYPDPLP